MIAVSAIEPTTRDINERDIEMKLRVGLLLASVFFSLTAQARAQEELLEKDLIIEAEYPRSATNTAFGFGSLWIANGFKIVRLDGASGEIIEIGLTGSSQKQRKITVGDGAVWVPDVGTDTLFKIDPIENQVIGAFPVDMLATQGSIAVGAGSVWVILADNFEKTLARLDADSGEEQAKIALPNTGVGVAFGYNAVWVTSGMGDALYRVDAETNVVTEELKIGDGPLFATVGDGSVWVHIQSDASVVRVDGNDGTITARIETGLPSGAADIEFGDGYLWMNTPYNVPLAQIDPVSNTVARKFSGAQGADAVDFGEGTLWISGRSVKKVTLPE